MAVAHKGDGSHGLGDGHAELADPLLGDGVDGAARSVREDACLLGRRDDRPPEPRIAARVRRVPRGGPEARLDRGGLDLCGSRGGLPRRPGVEEREQEGEDRSREQPAPDARGERMTGGRLHEEENRERAG
jgi:hypothetical protein